MAGRRKTPPVRCEAMVGAKQCLSHLGTGWTRCPHHIWKGAVEFAAALEEGAAVPKEPGRHELLGLGIYAAARLAAGQPLSLENE